MGGRPIKRANPEHKLQSSVREYLTVALPPSILWSADAAGVHVTMYTANKMKGAGVRRGWPDLRFLFPDGVTRYIELKAPGGSMTPEQKVFAARCEPHGIFALARSVDDVAATLARWGAPLRAHPFYPIATEAHAPP